MISDKTIALAVERSVIDADQAERLLAIEHEFASSAVPEPQDDESLRFVTGFADIFVTLGITLFLGALAFIMNARTGSTPMYAGMAACAWLLAEFFTGKRRMALPSIVLLVVFAASVFVLSAQIFASALPQTRVVPGHWWFAPSQEYAPLALAALVTAGMAVMHYVRFHVPITIAAGVAALCVLALTIVVAAVPSIGETGFDVPLLACGLVVFALAMRFDMSDPERKTRRTDIAFWLHLLAAPLIVHPLVSGLLHGFDTRQTQAAAVGILWTFLALGALAVVIDRRAILVSGLVYAGIAYGSLIKGLVSTSSLLIPVVLLTLGGFILLVSAGWHRLRRAILKRLPTALARRLPHPLARPAT